MPQRSHRSTFPRPLSLVAVCGLLLVVSACATSHSQPKASQARAQPTPTPTEPAVAPPNPTAYAALGASETYGVGAAPHTRGYAYLVARALHAKPFVDAGIPGTTLDNAYETELSAALAIRPRLCTVFFGFNDLAAQVPRQSFLQDLHDFLATLRRARAQVLIIGLPDLAQLPATAHRFPELHQITSEWNRGMRNVARQTGARFLDLSEYAAELRAHPEYISSDGLHPSNAGHRRLAQVVLSAIRADHLWGRR